MSSQNRPGISRRDFTKFSIAGAGLAMGGLPAFSWARVRGANDRINIAVIGCGGMGSSHLGTLMDKRTSDNLTLTRVCDLYRRRLNSAAKRIEGGGGDNGSPKPTMEYREVLDDKDVDAILIATPDHWHTKIAIEAMDAGKHVYCEKPLSHTIEQAIACRDAVKRTGKTLQVGPQGTSEDRIYKAREAIAAGRIGKPVWSQGSYCRNSRGGQFNWTIDPDASPDLAHDHEGYVWWDRWLGHEHGLAPKIPWNPDHFFRFRKYFAYNGGLATDLLYHRLAPLLLAIVGPNGEYPKRVVASGGRYLEKDERDIPDTFMMMVDYPSEHTVVLVSVMTNEDGLEDKIRGQHGTITLAGSTLKFKEESEWMKEFRRANEDLCRTGSRKNDKGVDVPDPDPGQAKFEIKAGDRRDHEANFLDAIRGKAPLACNVDLGCSTMVAIKMAVESYRQNKVMLWDAKKETMSPG